MYVVLTVCSETVLRWEPTGVRTFLIYEKIGKHLEWNVLFHFPVKAQKLFGQVCDQRMKQE